MEASTIGIEMPEERKKYASTTRATALAAHEAHDGGDGEQVRPRRLGLGRPDEQGAGAPTAATASVRGTVRAKPQSTCSRVRPKAAGRRPLGKTGENQGNK